MPRDTSRRGSSKQIAHQLFLLCLIATCASCTLANLRTPEEARASQAREGQNNSSNRPRSHQDQVPALETDCAHRETASASSGEHPSERLNNIAPSFDTCNHFNATTCAIRERRLEVGAMRARGEHRWRMDYHDEQVPGFEMLVEDDSLDQRMANIIHTINSIRVVNTEIHSFNSGDPQVDLQTIESIAGPEVDSEVCNHQLGAMIELLDDLGERLDRRRSNSSVPLDLDERHIRLARVLDSYGRYESGLMSGKSLMIGQFDQCVGTSLLLAGAAKFEDNNPAVERVSTRYCWAGLAVGKHLDSGLRARPRTPFEWAHDRLEMAVCIPRSCHTKTFGDENRELIQRLIDSQMKLPHSLYIDERLEIESLYCLVDQDSPRASLSLGGKLAILVLVGWFGAAIYATTMFKSGIGATTSLVAPIMKCLNLRTSLENLLGQYKLSSAEQEKQQLQAISGKWVDLEVLNSVKVLACAFVVLGHSMMMTAVVNQDALRSFYLVMAEPKFLALVAGTYLVDTFFVITGLLMGYTVMKQSASQRTIKLNETITNGNAQLTSKQRTGDGPGNSSGASNQVVLLLKHWTKFAITRHLRLIPMMFLVFWFKKTVYIDLFGGGSPIWDYGFNKETPHGACRQQSWLSSFRLEAAFSPLSKQCMAQTWSVSTDLFFSLVMPPVMLLLPSRPRLALLLGGTMTLASYAWATHKYYALTGGDLLAFRRISSESIVLMFGRLHYLYTYPHYRICSITAGLVAGYTLYKYQESRQQRTARQSIGWPKWVQTLTWMASSFVLLMPVFFSYLPKIKHLIIPDSHVIFSNFYTIARVIWAAANATLFLRMASDWNQSFLMRLSAGRLFTSLSKLNYAILLIHMDVLVYLMSSRTSLFYMSPLGLLNEFSSAYFYCIPVATFLYVVYEYPTDKLIRRLVMPKVDRLLL